MSEVSGIDDYVAWLTFRKKDGTHSDGRIRICDSDSPGAFKVYRAAPITARVRNSPRLVRYFLTAPRTSDQNPQDADRTD